MLLPCSEDRPIRIAPARVAISRVTESFKSFMLCGEVRQYVVYPRRPPPSLRHTKTALVSGSLFPSPQNVLTCRPKPSWSTCLDDVRTWIQDTTEYFVLPDLNVCEENEVIVPSLSDAA